jgi:hypothetical protein
MQRRRDVGEGDDGRDVEAEDRATRHRPDLVAPPVKAATVEAAHAVVPKARVGRRRVRVRIWRGARGGGVGGHGPRAVEEERAGA